MKINTLKSLFRAETNSRYSANLSYRPRLEHLEERCLLSVSPAHGAAVSPDVAAGPIVMVIKTDNAGGSSSVPSTGTVTPGQPLTYTVLVENTGTGAADGVTFADPILPGFTAAAYTSTLAGGATDSTPHGSGSINDLVNLPAASSITYTITGTVSPLVAGGSTLTNTATATSVALGLNASATDNDDVVIPVLSITKTDNAGGSSITPSTGNVTPGQPMTYTVTVSNAAGPGTAYGATIADSMPPFLIGGKWTATGSGGAMGFTGSGSGDIDDTNVTMPSGSTITYTITATISPTVNGFLSNSATVTPLGGNSVLATDTDAVSDLSIIKSDTDGGSSNLQTVTSSPAGMTGNATVGTPFTYTVVVSNSGPGTVTGAKVTDPVPANFTVVSYTTLLGGGATDTTPPTAPGNINDTVTLPPSSSVTYVITGTVNSTASGTLSNTATVTPPSGGTAVSATDVDNLADLTITKTDNSSTPGTVTPGQPLIYTVTVHNSGPGNVIGATVADLMPPAFIGGTYTTALSSPSASDTNPSGSGNIHDTVTLLAGGTITYTVTGTVSPSAPSGLMLANTATVTPSGGSPISATDTDSVVVPVLSITKVDNSGGSSITSSTGNVTPGQVLTYTVVVNNAGPGTAYGATVADTMPSFFTAASYTTTLSGGATDSRPTGAGPLDDTATLPSGSSITYTITGTISPNANGFLSNTATVTPSFGSALSATDNDVVADLSIIKSDTDHGTSNLQTVTSKPVGVIGAATAGTPMTYTVVVSNSGPGTVTGAKVNDPVPSGFTGGTYTTMLAGGATDSNPTGSAGTINDTVTLPPGSSITYVITGTVNSAFTGTLSNTATITPPSGGLPISATDTDNVTAPAPSSLSGYVYVDPGGGGTRIPADPGIPNVTVVLTGTTTGGGTVNTTTTTDATGYYNFPNLAAGNYTITETQPTNYIEGKGDDQVGSQNSGTVVQTPTTNAIQNITLLAGVNGINNNFGNLGLTTAAVSKRSFLNPPPDVTIIKSDSAGGTSNLQAVASSPVGTIGNATAGQTLTYTVVVSNAGAAGTGTITGAAILDDFPSGFSESSWTSSATGGATGNTNNSTPGTNIDDTVNLPPGSTITYTVHGTISSTATGTLSNAASVTPPLYSTVTATDTDNLADPGVIKSDNAGGSSGSSTVPATTGNVTPGQVLIYTVIVSNTGPGNLTGATIADPIPSDITGAKWTAASTGSVAATGFSASGSGNIDDTSVNLPAGSQVTYTVSGTVVGTATGTFSNTATVTPPLGGTPKSATDTDDVTALTITKSDNAGGASITLSNSATTGNVTPGQVLTYTVVVSNAGPGSISGATVTDSMLTSIFTKDKWYATTFTGGATDTTPGGTGNIDDTGVNLPAGSSITYTVTGTVSPNATGTLTNTATITPLVGNPASATDNDNLANLSITKVDNEGGSSITGASGNVMPGQTLVYTVVVKNTGLGNVTGATIADAMLTGVFTSDSWTATSTGGATGFTASGSGNIDDTSVNLPAGSSITYTVTGAVSSKSTGTLSNSATVTPSSGTPKTATDNDNLADLEIIKSDNAGGTSNLQTDTSTPAGVTGNVIPGQPLTYTIVVSNTGPGNATGVTIADTIPSTLIGVTWSAASTGSATATGFSPSGTGNVIDQTGVSLPSGSAITYVVTGTFVSTTTSSLSNSATVTPSVGTAISATDNDNVTDLSITKSDNAGGSSVIPPEDGGDPTGNVTPGQVLIYTVVVSNGGPGNLTGATITDPNLTNNLINDKWYATATDSAAGFTVHGSGNIDDTGVSLPAGSSITYTISGTVSPNATGTLTNTATLTPPVGTPISATDTDDLADLSITKTDNAGGSSITGATGTPKPGQTLIYTIVVSNTGPGSVTGATIADTFPSGYNEESWTASESGGASGATLSNSTPGSNIDDTGVDLPAGSKITYTVTGTISSVAMGTMSNTATVTSAGVPKTATDNDNILCVPNLIITKVDNAGGSSITPSVGNAIPGQLLTYTIVVSNTGNSATGITIADLDLTSVFTSDTWTATSTTVPPATGFSTSGSGNIDDTDVTMLAGSKITYTVTGTVSPTATGTLSNTASVTPFGGTASLATDNDNLADLAITKVDNAGGSSIVPSTGNVIPGQTLIYTVVVSNAGPGSVTGAAITDTFPATFSEESWTSSETGGASGNTDNSTPGSNIDDTVNLPAGSSITYTITGSVASTVTGSMSNTATVTPPVGTPLSATDDDNLADLSITKSDNAGGSSVIPDGNNDPTGNVIPGQTLIYTVVVSNAGPGSVTGATITDTFPADFSEESWTSSETGGASGNTNNSTPETNIDDTVNLPSGSSITYTITGSVSSTATGSMSNTATVTPPVGTPKSATDTDDLADLSITKTDNAGGSSIVPSTGIVTPFQTLIYTVVVSNTGPGSVTGAAITDTFPASFSEESWTSSETGGASGNTNNSTPGTSIDDTVNLPSGSSITYTITGTVGTTIAASLSNTATVTPPVGTPKSATDTDNVVDLSITKTDNAGGSSIVPSTGNVTPGQTLIYTVVVSNFGPGNATGVTIADAFPPGFSEQSWTSSETGGASGNTNNSTPGTNIDDTVNLPSGSSITYTVNGAVIGATSLSNTATVTPPVGTAIPATDNDTIQEIIPGVILAGPSTENAAAKSIPTPAASSSTTLHAAVDAVFSGGPGRHAWEPTDQGSVSAPLTAALSAALTGGSSNKTPSASSFAALIDSVLLNLNEPIFHRFI